MMITIKVELEFDEEQLGKGWMNEDNLELLLYSRNATRRELLPIRMYREVRSE